MHHGIQPLNEQIHVQHILRQQYGEGVSRQVAGKPPLARDGIEVGGGSLEDGITCFHVEKLIDQLEAGYVEVNEAIARFRIAGYLVSCLLFALLHVWQFAVVRQDVTYFLVMLQYLVPGVVLAWAYEHSGTLWASIGVHVVANALSVWTMM